MQNRTEKEILNVMLTHLKETGGIITESEISKILEGKYNDNQYVLDLDIHAYILGEIESIIKEVENGLNVNTATGDYLDILGALVGVHRINSQPAVLTITVRNNTTNSITIPEGTKIVLDNLYSDFDFVTREEVVISPGSSDVEVIVENSVYEYISSIPEGMARSVQGYTDAIITDSTSSTNGCNIEEDDEYRNRVKNWVQRSIRGTRACITDYLDNYTGVDSYNIIPAYNGGGTLGIVCDTQESLLNSIRDDVYEECMCAYDLKPIVQLPESITLSNLNVYVNKSTENTLTDAELMQRINELIHIFTDGGIWNGKSYTGMSVGEDFSPSGLIQFLKNELASIENIYLKTVEGSSESNITTLINVPDTHLFSIESVVVNFL